MPLFEENKPMWQQEAEKRLSTYQLRLPFIVYGYGHDRQVIIGKPGETHDVLWNRIGFFHVDSAARGYYLIPLKALSWWDTPVPQRVKDTAVEAFEQQRKPVHDANFPLFLMKEALQLVNAGKKREVGSLVKSARKAMDDTAMWRQNMGLRHEEFDMTREELIEAILESVSVRSRETLEKALVGGGALSLMKKYPRAVKAVYHSEENRLKAKKPSSSGRLDNLRINRHHFKRALSPKGKFNL